MAVIHKLPNGKWMLDFYVGKKRHRPTFQSRREAEDAMREVKLGLTRSETTALDFEPKPLKDAMLFYVETFSSKKASGVNEKKYLERLYKFLRTESVLLTHEVKPEHLEAFRTQRAAKIKAATVNREFNTYRHFFNKCVDFKWIESSPADSVETMPAPKNPRRVWSPQEFEVVVSKVPDWAGDVLRMMNWTGAGPTEIGRVTWSDVDFERRTILLKRFKGTGEEFRRHAYMNDPDFAEFMDLKYRLAKSRKRAKASHHAFLGGTGKPIDVRQLARLVNRQVRLLGLPNGTVPYGLRHTFATEMLEAGVGEDQVRKLLGHRDVRTLIENYAHVREASLKDAARVRGDQVRKNDGGGKRE